MSYFDNLIRDGRDTDAVRFLAREYYNSGKMGHIRKMLLERVAERHDALKYENAKLRAVVEAARGVFLGEGEHLCSEFEDAMDMLEQAIAELDKEGER
mgnify:CR=1 FL=1